MYKEGLAEQHEQPTFSTSTLNSEEFLDRIYQGQTLPQDKRFSYTNEPPVFKYFDLRQIDSTNKRNQFFSIIESEKEIAGIASLEVNPYDPEVLWIELVSIDPNYHGEKLSRPLLGEVFQFAKQHNYTLEASAYSIIGSQKLKPLLQELSKQFEVKFIDSAGTI